LRGLLRWRLLVLRLLLVLGLQKLRLLRLLRLVLGLLVFRPLLRRLRWPKELLLRRLRWPQLLQLLFRPRLLLLLRPSLLLSDRQTRVVVVVEHLLVAVGRLPLLLRRNRVGLSGSSNELVLLVLVVFLLVMGLQLQWLLLLARPRLRLVLKLPRALLLKLVVLRRVLHVGVVRLLLRQLLNRCRRRLRVTASASASSSASQH
jgi:hypothetical protein